MSAFLQRIAILACCSAAVGCDRGDTELGKQSATQATTPHNEDGTRATGKSEHEQNVAKERKLLDERLDRECDRLAETLAGSTGEQRAGILNQLARLATARAIGIVSENYDGLEPNWQATLVNMVAASGNPASASLLLRIANTGNVGERQHAIDRLYLTLGKDAHAHLLSLRQSEKHPQVLFAIKQELLKLKEPAVIAEIRRDFKSFSDRKISDSQRASHLLHLPDETHCTELADEVGELFLNVDWSQSDSHCKLKLRAAGVALGLGHRASVGQVISLLKEPGSARFDDSGQHSFDTLLRMYTKQEFKTPDEWQAWWDREGKTTPLFTGFIQRDEEAGIMNAVLRWGRSPLSGPFISVGTVYLQASSNSGWDRDRVWKGLGEDVRVYAPMEIGLLGVPSYGIHSISSNGMKAYATLGDGRFPAKWRLVHLELEKTMGSWKVVRKIHG